VNEHGFPTKHGDRFACPNCEAGYVASDDERKIREKDDVRCKCCGVVMIAWPAIGLRLVSWLPEKEPR
jgi:predicted Zn finger-like uncharacterized protein